MARHEDLERLLLEHLELSRSVIRRIIRQKADVDDVLQEVCLKFCELIKARKLSVKGCSPELVCCISRTKSLDFLRKRNGRPRKNDEEAPESCSDRKRPRPKTLPILENQVATSDDDRTVDLLAAEALVECIRDHDPDSVYLRWKLGHMNLEEIAQTEKYRKECDRIRGVEEDDSKYFDTLHSVRKQRDQEKEEWGEGSKDDAIYLSTVAFIRKLKNENGVSFSSDMVEKIMARFDPSEKP